MKREPVVIVNGLIAIIETSIALAVGFGFIEWGPKETGLIMAVVMAIGNLVKTLWARGLVTPVAAPRDNKGFHLAPKPQI